jgi:glycosyltransferase involved in cell wall biosynthesis
VYIAAHLGTRIWGGAERATTLLLAGLRKRGHRVQLFCNEPLVAEKAAAMGVPARVLAIGGDAALPHALRFALVLRKDRPDALVVAGWKKVPLASLGARLAGVPRVVARVGLEGHAPRGPKYRLALRWWVDAVVVNASRLRPAFTALPGWTPARVPVIHNAVHPHPARHSPAEVRERLGIPPGAPVVGAVARLARQKRFDRLLEAVAALPADVHCVLAGEGRRREELEALADRLGLGTRVHFPGWRADPADVLGAFDVFAVTSDKEGMSNAMLEALAAGVPVVSTPVSGADDALAPLADGAAPGIVTRGFEVEEIADALRSVLEDPGRRAAMADAARRAAAERFDFERMLDRWEAVLGGGRPADPPK